MRKIILQYMKMKIAQGDLLMRTSEMEKVKQFGFQQYGRSHPVGTYERRFREIRNDPKRLESIGIRELKDVSDQFLSKEKTFRIMKTDELAL